MLERFRARATRLPSFAAASHLTAATLHGIPLPLGVENEVLHVTVPLGKRAPAGRGIVGHQVECRPSDADWRHGVLCTTPARTFCDLAAMLPLSALVAVGDDLLHRELATLGELTAAADHHCGRRGRKRLVRAIELLDAGAESPKESELRVLLIERGLPKPESNLVVRDRGTFVARVDLAYPLMKIAIEYEGDHHRDPRQWRRDQTRRRRLEALGWIYLPVTQADLDDPSSFLQDLDAARTRSLAATRP